MRCLRLKRWKTIKKRGFSAPFLSVSGVIPVGYQTENDEPQPQLVDAFGFLITNCAPLMSSL